MMLLKHSNEIITPLQIVMIVIVGISFLNVTSLDKVNYTANTLTGVSNPINYGDGCSFVDVTTGVTIRDGSGLLL